MGSREARSQREGVVLRVGHTWDGEVARPDEQTELSVAFTDDSLRIHVRAPFHGDPPPSSPAGTSCDGLWNFEVVELFLVGDNQRYTEIELGPYGHYLVLQLQGVRNVRAKGLPLEYRAAIEMGKAEAAGDPEALGPMVWTGEARVPFAYLPPVAQNRLYRFNAYAIHGLGTQRRYLAHSPVHGPRPDFHRIEVFPTLPPLSSP